MSFTSLDALPPIDPALEPASVRGGSQAAKQAYQSGLAFEQVLVDQLAQQLTATAGAGDGGGGEGSDDSSGDGGGLMGADPAAGAYADLLPQALSSSVMSAGGLGLAAQLATSFTPAASSAAPTTGGAA